MLDIVFNVLTYIFLIAPFAQGLTTWHLWRAWRASRDNRRGALAERFINSVIRLLAGLIVAGLALNRLENWHWDNYLAVSLLYVVIVLNLIPSVVWLYMYYTDKF
jgi:DNA-binding transcriptional LysR family regulator